MVLISCKLIRIISTVGVNGGCDFQEQALDMITGFCDIFMRPIMNVCNSLTNYD